MYSVCVVCNIYNVSINIALRLINIHVPQRSIVLAYAALPLLDFIF